MKNVGIEWAATNAMEVVWCRQTVWLPTFLKICVQNKKETQNRFRTTRG